MLTAQSHSGHTNKTHSHESTNTVCVPEKGHISGNCLLCSLTEQQPAAWLLLLDELRSQPFSIFFLLHLN